MSTCTAADVISSFTDSHRFLSTFSHHPASYAGVTYPTAEHAFAAAKADPGRWREKVAAADTPEEANRIGRSLPLRGDWPEIRLDVAHEIVHSKFTSTPGLRERLIATGDALLIDANNRHEQLWGRSKERGFTTPTGRNELGRTLMRVRSELRGDDPRRWVRVAITGHREDHIDAGDHGWVKDELARVTGKLRTVHETAVGICSLTPGADTWWAEQVVDDPRTTLWAYESYPEQTWGWNARQKAQRDTLAAAAARRVVVGNRTDNKFLAARNELMLGDVDAVVAVKSSAITHGGTAATLRMNGRRRPVITIDPATRNTHIDMGVSTALAATH